MESRIELRGPGMVVMSGHVLEVPAKILHPIDGGPAQPLLAVRVDDTAVDGASVAWTDLGGEPSVNFYDPALEYVRTVALPADLAPVPGTLAAGDGTIAWSYRTESGKLAAAVLPRGATAPERYASALAENRTVVAVLRTDLFFSKTADGSDLWVLNTSGGPEVQVAYTLGAARTATGAFFVAWVNASSNRVDYFDVLDRIVEHIDAPADVTVQWVKADGLTILIGGTKPGLLFSSPKVEFYDFAVGAAHVYDSIGVDFDASPVFGYADRTVVVYTSETAQRAPAPLTPALVAAAGLLVAAALFVGLRQVFGQDGDL
jgi:hypothetical protein